MPKRIIGQTFEEERSLYGLEDAIVECCNFKGELDGESPLKECKNITLRESHFDLRYPLWHVDSLSIDSITLSELSRAALWYCKNVSISNSSLHGIKALRECEDVKIKSSDIKSNEFGWFTNNVSLIESMIEAEYAFLKSKNLKFSNLTFKGKYSFQYIENAIFENCTFDTKDAFWHSRNVVVKNCEIKGEYLAWYASDITFINCKIIGTQPLCYCNNLTLINCEMIDTDLAFENSSVNAQINNVIDSIKNPLSGEIRVKGVKEIIIDNDKYQGKILVEE